MYHAHDKLLMPFAEPVCRWVRFGKRTHREGVLGGENTHCAVSKDSARLPRKDGVWRLIGFGSVELGFGENEPKLVCPENSMYSFELEWLRLTSEAVLYNRAGIAEAFAADP